ncbi:MAG: YHYH protein, partial [Rhodospirillaceae bacterium]
MTTGPKAAWSLSNQVSITEAPPWRRIRANGIPDHATGSFPNRGNPNSIRAQSYDFQLPLSPTANAQPTPMRTGISFGVAVNGVLFDPFTAEFWNRSPRSGWVYEALTGGLNLGLDANNAHVQPNGAYHYHGIPKGLIRQWSPSVHSPILGWAADGFPIYVLVGFSDPRNPNSGARILRSSWTLKTGNRPGGNEGPGGAYDGRFTADWTYQEGRGDLDICNGRYCVTPDFPEGTYAYFLTEDFPVIPRFHRGTPIAAFQQGQGGGSPPGGGPQHGGGSGIRRPPPGGGPPRHGP